MIVMLIICHVILIQEKGYEMKKIFVFLLTHLLFSFIFAQNFIEPNIITKLDIDEYFKEYNQSYVTGKKEKSYIVWNWASKEGLKFSQETINQEIDGYQFLYINNEKNFLLYDSNFLFIFSSTNWQTIDYEHCSSLKSVVESIKIFNEENNSLNYISVCDFNINTIHNSSFYNEKTRNGEIVYAADLLNIIMYSRIDSSTFLLHNPWVPGKEKNSSGIGEYLEIEFTKPKDNLVVLNGFVDFDKRYLYKANNRVKKAVISSLDKDNQFEIEYDFEDYVHFSEINFPKAVNKVRFTIKEVYKGEKWDDTCITAVITRWEE